MRHISFNSTCTRVGGARYSNSNGQRGCFAYSSCCMKNPIAHNLTVSCSVLFWEDLSGSTAFVLDKRAHLAAGNKSCSQSRDTAVPGRHPVATRTRFSYFLPFLALYHLLPPFRHRIIASPNNENISPLKALASLHSLAEFVPSASPPAVSGRKRENKYILLTPSLKPDAWARACPPSG